MLHAKLHGIGRCSCRCLNIGNPETPQLLLEGFMRVGDVGTRLGAPTAVDEDWQIAAQSDRIHVVKHEEAIAAEHVLHVVLGRDDQHVKALRLH